MKSLVQLLAALLSVCTLNACVSQQQQIAFDMANEHIAEMQFASSNKDYISAYWKCGEVARIGTRQQAEQARALMASDEFGRGIETQVLNNTNQYFSMDALDRFETVLLDLIQTNRYIRENYDTIKSKMQENAKQQIVSGNVPVTFLDVKRYEFLKSKEIMPVAYKQSVAMLQQTTHPMLLEATLELVQDPLCVSCLKNFKKDAKSLKYTRSMAENPQIATLAGTSAVNAALQTIPAVFISADPADRLMGIDVADILKTKEGLRIVSSEGKDVFTVKIVKLAYEERATPAVAQTIIYNYYQCDPMTAILYMPKNASYLYEYITSSASVEYAYEITLYKGKQKIADTLIRDTISDSTAYCKNARVQNVFGGISSASFIANAHMQSQCAGGVEREVSPAKLKASVQQALAGAIEQMVCSASGS